MGKKGCGKMAKDGFKTRTESKCVCVSHAGESMNPRHWVDSEKGVMGAESGETKVQ